MVKIDLPYLWLTTVKGHRYAYYRRGGQNLPIKNEDDRRLLPEDPGFATAYDVIHKSIDTPGSSTPASGTLSALIIEYRKSSKFRQ